MPTEDPASTPPRAKVEPDDSIRISRATTTPKTPRDQAATKSESTDLERRVLAHERILQVLIAHMAETEPKFLIRLSDTFCVPLDMSRSEHDYTDTESYAAEFIRSVVRLGDKAARKHLVAARERRVHKVEAAATDSEAMLITKAPRMQMRQAGGIWRVTLDGRFYGDFLQEQDAAAAVVADQSVPARVS
jgi:hypothetical protein